MRVKLIGVSDKARKSESVAKGNGDYGPAEGAHFRRRQIDGACSKSLTVSSPRTNFPPTFLKPARKKNERRKRTCACHGTDNEAAPKKMVALFAKRGLDRRRLGAID
jgi:hypothetical protein